MYRLRLTDENAALIRDLHPTLKHKVRQALDNVMRHPLCGKPLKDELSGLRSLRVSRFRVVYRPPGPDKVIEIVALGPRKRIYEETLRLLRRSVPDR